MVGRAAIDARSIPAWAGKPPSQVSDAEMERVHPRVGGETTIQGAN